MAPLRNKIDFSYKKNHNSHLHRSFSLTFLAERQKPVNNEENAVANATPPIPKN